MATSDPIAEIIGDYRAFAAMQRDRLIARGIDISPYALSHLAVRVADWDLYVHQRTLLERHARANSENLWNGRPISLIVLAEPLGHRRAVLEAVARAAPDQPDIGMRRVWGCDEVCVRRELVARRARLEERRVLERGKTVAQVRAHQRLSGRFIRKLGVGVERRPFVVDRRLDA